MTYLKNWFGMLAIVIINVELFSPFDWQFWVIATFSGIYFTPLCKLNKN